MFPVPVARWNVRPRTHDDDEDGVSAETPAQRLHRHDQENGIDWDRDTPPRQRPGTAVQDLADALVEVCAAYLRGKIVSADNADVYQVIIHAGTQAISTEDTEPAEDPEPDAAGEPDGVSAETPASPPAKTPDPSAWHPAHPGRCHLDDGPAIHPAALRLIGCNATISTMIHDTDGNVLNAGRRTRKPPAALRRAIHERDGSRCQYLGCQYLGCESRRTEAHVQEWLDAYHQDWKREKGGHWAVARDDGHVLGRIALRRFDFDDGIAGIGYWVLPAARAVLVSRVRAAGNCGGEPGRQPGCTGRGPAMGRG